MSSSEAANLVKAIVDKVIKSHVNAGPTDERTEGLESQMARNIKSELDRDFEGVWSVVLGENMIMRMDQDPNLPLFHLTSDKYNVFIFRRC